VRGISWIWCVQSGHVTVCLTCGDGPPSLVAGLPHRPTFMRHLGGPLVADPFDEDADIHSHLAVLGPSALAELRRISIEGPSLASTTPSGRTQSLRLATAPCPPLSVTRSESLG
jgi:hypothetical protein